MSDTTYARTLVTGVLADLGLGGDGWRVIDVVEAGETVKHPRPGLRSVTHHVITVGGSNDTTFQAYFTDGVERAEASAATAEQIQDHAIELLGGTSVPPCPGHGHPLQPQVMNGEPMWVCPLDPDHHRAPLSGAR